MYLFNYLFVFICLFVFLWQKRVSIVKQWTLLNVCNKLYVGGFCHWACSCGRCSADVFSLLPRPRSHTICLAEYQVAVVIERKGGLLGNLGSQKENITRQKGHKRHMGLMGNVSQIAGLHHGDQRSLWEVWRTCR